MKLYRIKVNGKLYEVELESVETSDKQIVKEDTKVSESITSGSHKILAPMQGNILRVDVKAGSMVQKGQCLLILEAMKLENEILAPVDGKVLEIAVAPGQTVNTNDLLAVIG